MPKKTAIVGVSDRWGWAVIVTVDADGTVIDRRRVELVDDDLPPFPHHHEALTLQPDEGVALVERVRASVIRCAGARLATLAAEVATKITGIALRTCPELPPTVAERLTSYRAQNVADSVMYRDALADAAAARGWSVSRYEARRVVGDAARSLGRTRIDDLLRAPGRALGPPWQQDHRLAMAAAIAATTRQSPR